MIVHMEMTSDDHHKNFLRSMPWFQPLPCPCCEKCFVTFDKWIKHLCQHVLRLKVHQCPIPGCPVNLQDPMNHTNFLRHVICLHKLTLRPAARYLYPECKETLLRDPLWKRLIELGSIPRVSATNFRFQLDPDYIPGKLLTDQCVMDLLRAGFTTSLRGCLRDSNSLIEADNGYLDDRRAELRDNPRCCEPTMQQRVLMMQ